MLWRNGRSGMLLALFCLLLGTCIPAQAQTYTGWAQVGDRYWQVMADVQKPASGANYYTTYSSTQVPHAGAYRNALSQVYDTGLAQHNYVNVGELERFSAYHGYWMPFSDEIRYNTQPSSPGASYSYYWWYNPPAYDGYWAWVLVHNNWNQCEATTSSTDRSMGLSRTVLERVLYRVLRSGG